MTRAHVLCAPGVRAVIDADAGARLTSLVIHGQEVIASCDEPDAIHDWYRGCFPLTPWAGNLTDAAFVFAGKRYEVETDSRGQAKHGIVSELPWEVGEATDTQVCLDVKFGPRSAAKWPFCGRAVLRYTLSSTSLSLRLEVHSETETMPATAGFHPWFRTSLDGGEASVSFHPTARIVGDGAGGHKVLRDNMGQRPWDELFLDVPDAPCISWPDGPELTLETNARIWVYYERTPGGFCIEPWTGPVDALQTEWTSVVTPDQPLILDLKIGINAS